MREIMSSMPWWAAPAGLLLLWAMGMTLRAVSRFVCAENGKQAAQGEVNRALWDQIQRDLLIRAGDEWLHKAHAPKGQHYQRIVEPWYYDGVNKPNPCLYERPNVAQQFLEYHVGADSEKAGERE